MSGVYRTGTNSDGSSNWGSAGSTTQVATSAATAPEASATTTVPTFSRSSIARTVRRRIPTTRSAATS